MSRKNINVRWIAFLLFCMLFLFSVHADSIPVSLHLKRFSLWTNSQQYVTESNFNAQDFVITHMEGGPIVLKMRVRVIDNHMDDLRWNSFFEPHFLKIVRDSDRAIHFGFSGNLGPGNILAIAGRQVNWTLDKGGFIEGNFGR